MDIRGIFRKKRIARRLIAACLGTTLAVSTLAACKPDLSANDLVIGSGTLTGEFSPFFAREEGDVRVTELMQLQLLTVDRGGSIVYHAIEGEKRVYQNIEHEYRGPADINVEYDESENTTTYQIKLSESLFFSDGAQVTADDLIFTYYVLADPDYDGPSQFASAQIKGLQSYQYDNSILNDVKITQEQIRQEMDQPAEDVQQAIQASVIRPALEEAYARNQENWKDYADAYGIASAIELFIMYYNTDETADFTGEDDNAVLERISEQYGYDYQKLGQHISGDTLQYDAAVQELVSDMLLKRALGNGGAGVNAISGIRKLSDFEVEVQTEGYSPSAVYQICGVLIAPMHHYGDADSYDYENNAFGITRGDLSAIREKSGKPLGAGVYALVSYDAEKGRVSFYANEAYYKGIAKTRGVHLMQSEDRTRAAGVAMELFDLADASGTATLFHDIAFYQEQGDLIDTSAYDNLSYGYIGINADGVNVGGKSGSEASRNLRNAFAVLFAVYREEVIDAYFGNSALLIEYPVSGTSWVYPQDSDKTAFSERLNGSAIYDAGSDTQTKYKLALKAALEYFQAAGYASEDGKLTGAPEGAKLSYEVIIAGGGTGDHPAFGIFTKAKEALAQIGMELVITDPADESILFSRLAAGSQEIWAAAWSISAEPDFARVYYSGNRTGRGGTEQNYYGIDDSALDLLLEEAAGEPDSETRLDLYLQSMEKILDWAVEVPVYQRQTYTLASTERVQLTSLPEHMTVYWNWLNELEQIRMK